MEIQTKPEKGHAYVLGDRDTCRAEEEGKSAEFALATDRFLAPLICRVVRAVRVRARRRRTRNSTSRLGHLRCCSPNLRFRYTYSIFENDLKVTLTKPLFLLSDSNITTPCTLHVLQELSIFRWTCDKKLQNNMPMYSGHGTRPERRRSSSSTKSSKRHSHQTISRH